MNELVEVYRGVVFRLSGKLFTNQQVFSSPSSLNIFSFKVHLNLQVD